MIALSRPALRSVARWASGVAIFREEKRKADAEARRRTSTSSSYIAASGGSALRDVARQVAAAQAALGITGTWDPKVNQRASQDDGSGP